VSEGRGTPNHLHCGDNLTVPHDSIASERVDLITLDPPFISNTGIAAFQGPQ